MKTLQIICLAAILSFVGCKDQAANESEGQTKSDTIVTLPDAHNAENSLDWAGKYSGVLPCWDGCQGLITVLQIKADSTYTLSSQAMGQEKEPRTFAGKFSWDTAKNVITLDANGDHLKFQIMENRVKKLDKFGDEEQGGPAERYLMPKIQ
ncbi:MAG: copper resistance protein NlpE [Flavobacterium sp.]|nr:MAG: copper resistance protein NlpE [Flavobacterium sp.]